MYRLLLFLVIALIPPFYAPAISSEYAAPKKIVIPLNNWSSQRVLSHVVGTLIKKLGVDVDYQNISSTDQWGALRQGIVHLQVEVWEGSLGQDYNQMVNNNYLLDMGTHSAIVREEWWYPDYVEKLCPELPDWKALNICAQLFSNKSSLNKGVYYTGPWDLADGDIIRALDLNFSIKRFADDKALWKELNNAIATQRPIVLFNWTPNWTDVRVKGKFIEFPSYSLECEQNPSWGINKNLTKDCGNVKKGWLKKGAWIGFQDTWPCVSQLVKRIDFSNEMIAEASALVIVDGLSEESAAKLWLKQYKKSASSWLNIQCNR